MGRTGMNRLFAEWSCNERLSKNIQLKQIFYYEMIVEMLIIKLTHQDQNTFLLPGSWWCFFVSLLFLLQILLRYCSAADAGDCGDAVDVAAGRLCWRLSGMAQLKPNGPIPTNRRRRCAVRECERVDELKIAKMRHGLVTDVILTRSQSIDSH